MRALRPLLDCCRETAHAFARSGESSLGRPHGWLVLSSSARRQDGVQKLLNEVTGQRELRNSDAHTMRG